ncbi:heterokaryon incompatibility protein-domain-containing protein [Rhypophila decipiens]|uniref:Heterokaryon incompatibility protein-domain-containing protein n=1 Tax=Rhypophila decipiens TaxID=261697 RepID=A0AAN6Y014_9PEZI|nr:heterokaryon incompatibility protein-domain-containing protein [Rhypophila decipiens]
MSRWHTNCDNPDIFVDGVLPRCRNCEKAPSDTDITALEHAPDPPWTVPPDEPAGQLGLYWPPCVPYREDSPCGDEGLSDFGLRWLYDEPSAVSGSSEMDVLCHQRSSKSSISTISTVYSRPLKAGEFRLVSLEAPEHADPLVHLTLETYDRNNCPEYEATSYSWGGEDGDYTLSKPVFIGPNWDILFQTPNCWSMLQCLRPRNRTRNVWIDAICINQGDPRERAEQVDAMRETYRRSMRLVVYLGNDVVCAQNRDSYPLRCGLDDIERTSI